MLSLKIAARFLKASKGQTALIVVGIAIAISVQVFVGLLINGLQASFVDSIVSTSPQVTVTSATDNITIEDWRPIVDDIESFDEVRTVAVSASSNVFIVKGTRNEPGLLRGFDLEKADGIYSIRDAVYEGRMPANDDTVLVGKDLSEEMGYGIGSIVTVITPGGSTHNLTVSGLFDLQVESLNKQWLWTRLTAAQAIFGFGDRVTSIEVSVKDVFTADALAKRIEKRIDNDSVAVSNWIDSNEQLFSALSAQSLSSNMIQAFILFSVIIAIASILAITVLQKSRQIGILKAMGIKDRQASLIFLSQGFLIGLAAAFLGVVIGIVLVLGFTIGASGSSTSDFLQIRLEAGFLLSSFVVALLSSTFAALVPARKSSKLSPIEVIRGG